MALEQNAAQVGSKSAMFPQLEQQTNWRWESCPVTGEPPAAKPGLQSRAWPVIRPAAPAHHTTPQLRALANESLLLSLGFFCKAGPVSVPTFWQQRRFPAAAPHSGGTRAPVAASAPPPPPGHALNCARGAILPYPSGFRYRDQIRTTTRSASRMSCLPSGHRTWFARRQRRNTLRGKRRLCRYVVSAPLTRFRFPTVPVACFDCSCSSLFDPQSYLLAGFRASRGIAQCCGLLPLSIC